MIRFFVKTPALIKILFSKYIWEIPNLENKVYLTFDDGPTPDITEWVLNELQKVNAKATFFCIGDNIKKYPEIVQKVKGQGHSLGNHTFNHLNGWKTSTKDYIENTNRCDEEIRNSKLETRNLFRPPYGKIKPKQARILQKMGYKIIMWDVISYDFDTNISKEQCLENVIKNIKNGSIVVFHDSVKAFSHLEYVLPRVLKYLNENHYICEKISYKL